MELAELTRRAKVLVLSYEQVIQILLWEKHDQIVLPVMPSDFKDVTILGIHEDHERRGLAITMCHPSWPEVPPGQCLEHINFQLEQQVVRLEGRDFPYFLRQVAKTIMGDKGTRNAYADNVACVLMDRLGLQDKELRDAIAGEILHKIFQVPA